MKIKKNCPDRDLSSVVCPPFSMVKERGLKLGKIIAENEGRVIKNSLLMGGKGFEKLGEENFKGNDPIFFISNSSLKLLIISFLLSMWFQFLLVRKTMVIYPSFEYTSLSMCL